MILKVGGKGILRDRIGKEGVIKNINLQEGRGKEGINGMGMGNNNNGHKCHYHNILLGLVGVVGRRRRRFW